MPGFAQEARQITGQAFVDQEPHALSRTGSSRSSTARAAYPRQACTSAVVSCRYSARIWSIVSPLATRPTTVATGILVPATQGTPPMMRWSAEIRPRSTRPSWSWRGGRVKPAVAWRGCQRGFSHSRPDRVWPIRHFCHRRRLFRRRMRLPARSGTTAGPLAQGGEGPGHRADSRGFVGHGEAAGARSLGSRQFRGSGDDGQHTQLPGDNA